MATKLGKTPHIRLFIDKDGQLYILNQETKEKKLISMRANRDGTKTSRAMASEIEDEIWDFRWENKDATKAKPEETASA